jgi:N,N-dimethylformamidase
MTQTSMAELPITGYLDRFSGRPGDSLLVHVSLRDAGRYRARLQRVISGDPNPAGPGLRFEDLSAYFDLETEGRRQPIHLGSYALAPGPRREDGAGCWTILLWMAEERPTRAIMSHEAGPTRLTLRAGTEGASARLVWPGGVLELATTRSLRPRRWYRLWVSGDPASGHVRLGQQALDGEAAAFAEAQAVGLALPTEGTVLIAAEDATTPAAPFTGKLEEPAVLRGTVDIWPEPAARPPSARLDALWDFSIGIDTQAITDLGPQACHGTILNLPARGMVGARWTGQETCWRHAAADYGAIYFHDDDLLDCGWTADFSFEIPAGLKSGAYALHLSCDEGEDWLPFYVLAKRGGPYAPIAFLAPTFTYQAYANHARGNADGAYHARAAAWGAYPHNPDQYPIYSQSTYNRHADTSGFCFSSRLRPMLTMRPGFLTFNDARGSGLRHYPADTHLLAWLEAKGFEFDVLTDEDLDDEGVDLLRPYATVLTGSHPEYHTIGTLDALAAYTGQGGRLVYLGGNGFYWRIARRADLKHVIEIRRAEGGIRAWAAEPGEYHHALDGQLGGLWRRSRRPPQQLVGIGFSGQGLFEGTYYRRLPASYDRAHEWVFEGVVGEGGDADIFGGYGLSGGGAAGFELDRADFRLGTPENAAILARSENPPASFVTVPEELLTHVATITGESPTALMRAEIVLFETPSGGSVFSVGSITFCGSLWRDGFFDGPVSRILENVVRRFSRPPQG